MKTIQIISKDELREKLLETQYADIEDVFDDHLNEIEKLMIERNKIKLEKDDEVHEKWFTKYTQLQNRIVDKITEILYIEITSKE